MESAEPIPHADDGDHDLGDLVREHGRSLSVLLTTDPSIENAMQHSEARWKALRSDLVDRGVPEPLLETVDAAVPDAHLSGPTLAVVAFGSGVRHVEHGGPREDPTERADARWQWAPWLVPILAWRQGSLPHLVVLIDRRGADVFAFRREDGSVHREVDPPGEPLTRSKPGGWSQRRYQQRAENSWEQGAGDVAKALIRMARRFEPRVVVVAGDVRAVQFLREALPDEVNDLVRLTSGERPNPDGGEPFPQEEVDAIVAEVVERETAELLERFEQERGQGDLAVEGAEAVVAALARAQVEVLLIDEDADDARTAWVGPDPIHVATAREHLDAMAVDEPHEAPLRDAAIRAALGSSARVRVLQGDRGPREGIGALLRWSA